MDKNQSLIARMKAGRNLSAEIYFPGTEEKLTLKIVSAQEQQAAEFAAVKHFQKKEIEVSGVTLDAYDEEVLLQTLFRALSISGQPIAKDVEELRKFLIDDEMSALARAYNEFEQEVSPLRSCKTDKDIQELLEEVKKKPEQTLSNVSDSSTLRKLIIILASPDTL